MAERIRSAPRAAFVQLIERAIDEKVDFLIIAGDLYDGTWRDYKTGLFFAEQMGMLNQVAIPVFLGYGNHDAESQLTRPLVLPDNVEVFSGRRPETFQIETLNVALHGQSFRQRDVTDNLVPAYPAPLQGMFNIGVLHTGLGGRGGHANYAPCTLQAVNGGGIMLHARRPGGPVAAAQNCATHGPLSVATRGRRCTAWSSMRRFDWRLSTRV